MSEPNPFKALDALIQKRERADLMRFTLTLGGIKALLGMVERGERTAEGILPSIQRAVADHDREVEQAEAAGRRELEDLRVQCQAHMADLRRAAAGNE